MRKYYFRKVITKGEDFVLLYTIDEGLDKGSDYLANIENTQTVINKFNKTVEDFLVASFESSNNEAYKDFTSFEFNGYTINWCSYAEYIHSMNGINNPPIETNGYEAANQDLIYITMSEYYASVGRSVPVGVDPELSVPIYTRPLQKVYYGYKGANYDYFSKILSALGRQETANFAALPTIDLVNGVLESKNDTKKVVDDNKNSPILSVKEQVEALTKKMESFQEQGNYEQAAYCKQEIMLLLEQGDAVDVDFGSWIALIEKGVVDASDAFDYKKVAELRQQLAIISQANEKKNLSYYEKQLQEAEMSGNAVSIETWIRIVELAKEAKNKTL